MKNFELRLLILVSVFCLFSQYGNAKTTEFSMSDADSVSLVFNDYIENFKSNFNTRPYIALSYADSARRFAESADLDSVSCAKAYKYCGMSRYIVRNYPMALQFLFRAYRIYLDKNIENEIASCLVEIAKVYYMRELYDLAQQYCLNAIEICNTNNYPETKADAYCVLGRVAGMSGSGYNEAVYNIKYASFIYDSLNLSDKKFDVNVFLARAYIQGKSYDSAVKYLNKNFERYWQDDYKGKIAVTYNACGDVYAGKQDYTRALQYYRTALEMFEECGLKYNVMSVRNRIAKISFDIGNYTHAITEADKLCSEIKAYEITHKVKEYNLKHSIFNVLYSSYLKIGNNDSALKYCMLYANSGDSIFIIKNEERAVDFFLSAEGHKQEDELMEARFSHDRAKFNEAKTDYKRIYYILLGVIAVIVAFFLLFMHWYRGVVNENKTLTKNTLALEKEIVDRKASESELKTSEDKYRFVFRKVPAGIIQFNEQFVITSVNDACMQILGIKNKNLIGINVTTVLPPKIFEDLKAVNENSKDEDNVLKYELDLKTPDSDISVEVIIKSYYYNSGLDVGRAGIVMIQDITERKMEEKNQEGRVATVRNTFEMLPDTVFRLDEKANYIFSKIPGLPVDKQQAYLGKNMRAIVAGELLIKYLVAFNNVKKSGQTQYVSFKSENSEKTKEARFSLCSDSTVLLTIRDVNDENTNLTSQKVITEGKNIETGIQSEFISGISSEIKEPLQFILRSCETIAAKNTDSEYSDTLKEVINHASYVAETLSDLIKFSSAGQGLNTTGKANPSAIASDMFDIFSQRAREKNLEYKFECSPNVPKELEIDEMRVRQILFNLISNAIKYTSEGEVVLKVSTQAVSDGVINLLFSVKDTGKGLSADDLQKMFDGSQGRRGLVISKKMADTMKASIDVKSSNGQGSEFILTIPGLVVAGVEREMVSDSGVLPLRKDSLRDYISVLKYAVIPEFKFLKTDISFKELYDFAVRFREQSVNGNMEKAVALADKMLVDIKNYDIQNIMADSTQIEKYIHDLVEFSS